MFANYIPLQTSLECRDLEEHRQEIRAIAPSGDSLSHAPILLPQLCNMLQFE